MGEYEYDFDKFKNKNDNKIDKSRLASPQADMDIFSKFEELDEIENPFEEINIINVDKKEVNNTYNIEEELNKTKEITPIFDDVLNNLDNIIEQNINEIDEKILDNFDNNIEQNNIVIDEKILEKHNWPMEIATAFINCSVLGFVVAFWGYGIFFYIMSHI